MASKKQIQAELKEWGFEPAQYEDLEWPEMQAFYKSAVEQREASIAAVLDDIDTKAEADEQVINAASEADAGDSEAAVGAVSDAGDLDDEDVQDELDEGLEGDLQEMCALIGCDFESQGEVRVGIKVYRSGAKVTIKRGHRFLADECTAAYLKQHRVAWNA